MSGDVIIYHELIYLVSDGAGDTLRSIHLGRLFFKSQNCTYPSKWTERGGGRISRGALSSNRISRSDRGVRRLVPSIFPDRKIPISRRYNDPASASLFRGRLDAVVIVSVKVFLLRQMQQFPRKFAPAKLALFTLHSRSRGICKALPFEAKFAPSFPIAS